MFGHEKLAEDFKKLADAEHIGHAYLFYGEPETGKFFFAQCLSAYLLTGTWDESIEALPDVHVIDLLRGSESGAAAESVGIERIRELEDFLYQTPLRSGARVPYRIAIIRDAQALTDQAQNALLKILEEPPKSGIILATATDPSVFLPAIRSRFQLVFMPILEQGRIIDFLKESGIINPQKHTHADQARLAEDVAKRAYGRIGRAKKLAGGANERVLEALKLSKKTLQAKTAADKKKLSDDILEYFDADSGNMDVFLETLTEVLREDPVRNAHALHALCGFAFDAQTMTIQKRIHLKKVLWMIK